MNSSSPRTALTLVPSGALISGTPKNARKYIEAVSRTIRRLPWAVLTRGILPSAGDSATDRLGHRCAPAHRHPLVADRCVVVDHGGKHGRDVGARDVTAREVRGEADETGQRLVG